MILRTLHAVFKLSRWQKRLLMLLSDVLLIPLALWSSYALRLGTLVPVIKDGVWLMLVAVVVSIPIFIRLGLYRTVVRFLGNHALGMILIGVTASALILVLVTYFFKLQGIPRSVFLIYWGVSFLFIGGSRYLVRRYYQAIYKTNDREHVAIYGAGRSGAELAQVLFHNADYLPVLFLDDNTSLQQSFVTGLKVYSPSDIEELISRFDIKQVLIAMPTVSANRRREVIQYLEKFPVQIRTIPDLVDLVSGKSKIEEIREIDIDDLLGRVSVAPDPVLLNKCIKDKNVLVTGAGGSIGSELCRQIISNHPARLVLFERSEFALYKLEQELLALLKESEIACELMAILGSVDNESRLENVLRNHRIHTLYHAAAYKHVPLVEHNPIEGVWNNVIGTFTAAKVADEVGIEYFVLISTDKAVRPTNVMGASKRMAELAIQALAQRSKNTLFSMVRFGNVLDSSGSVVPLFRRQIQSGGPVTVTHPDIIRYFMTIPEAAQLVIQAGAIAKGGEVFLLDMGEPVKIFNLAKQMIRLTGLSVKDEVNTKGDIEIQFTGLRPGEKLYEELLIEGDALKTSHPRIFQAHEQSVEFDEYLQILDNLSEACQSLNEKQVIRLLKTNVSGYNPARHEEATVVSLQSKAS